MNSKNAIIASSIAAVVVGLVVVGVLIFRQRALQTSEAPAAPPPSGETTSQPQAQPQAAKPAEPQGLKDVVNAPPDYTRAKDTDKDGLTDPEESFYGTDPRKADTDGDGYSDYDEVHVYGTNPIDAKATPKTVQGNYVPDKGQPGP